MITRRRLFIAAAPALIIPKLALAGQGHFGLGLISGSNAVVSSGVWDPAKKNASWTLSLGNTLATNSSTTSGSLLGVLGRNNLKRYFEITIGGSLGSSQTVGFSTSAVNLANYFVGQDSAGVGYASDGNVYNASATIAPNLGGWASGDVIMVIVDFVAGKYAFGKNGVWALSGDPSTNNYPYGPFPAGTYYPAGASGNAAISYKLNVGDSGFVYSIPTGAVAWKT